MLHSVAADGVSADNKPKNTYEELRDKLKGTCLYLVGMMGTGKSSVGRALAEKVAYRFIDSDEAAEWMIEMPISDFFAQGKEDEFRELEYQVLMEMSQYTRVIVATGGGAVMQNKNWGLLRHGIVVHLDMTPADIYTRLSRDSEEVSKRPLLSGSDPEAKLAEILTDRKDKYDQADVHVNVSLDDSIENVASKVAEATLAFIARNPPFWQTKMQERERKAQTFDTIADAKDGESL